MCIAEGGLDKLICNWQSTLSCMFMKNEHSQWSYWPRVCYILWQCRSERIGPHNLATEKESIFEHCLFVFGALSLLFSYCTPFSRSQTSLLCCPVIMEWTDRLEQVLHQILQYFAHYTASLEWVSNNSEAIVPLTRAVTTLKNLDWTQDSCFFSRQLSSSMFLTLPFTV